jgi:hypothetical protein
VARGGAGGIGVVQRVREAREPPERGIQEGAGGWRGGGQERIGVGAGERFERCAEVQNRL